VSLPFYLDSEKNQEITSSLYSTTTENVFGPHHPGILDNMYNSQDDKIVEPYFHHQKMKIIFLDIDGVLNGYEDLRKGVELDPNKVLLINDVAKETGCQIVLSSAWRHSFSILTMQTLLNIAGLKDAPLIDYTPTVPGKRGDEIDAFFANTKDHYNIQSYVIVDDNSDFHEHQQKRFVKTNGKTGLTENDSSRICQILKDKSLFLP